MTIPDDNTRWQYQMTIPDGNTRWQYQVTILHADNTVSDDNIGWQHQMKTTDDNTEYTTERQITVNDNTRWKQQMPIRSTTPNDKLNDNTKWQQLVTLLDDKLIMIRKKTTSVYNPIKGIVSRKKMEFWRFSHIDGNFLIIRWRI
jgi:hypothetical protein